MILTSVGVRIYPEASTVLCNMDEEKKCGYCQAKLVDSDEVKQLTCSHQFCTTCLLEDKGTRGVIECPQCRKRFKTEKVEELETVHRNTASTSTAQHDIQCGCPTCKRTAMNFCETCLQPFCQKDWEIHESLHQHGKSTSISMYSSKKESYMKKVCSSHPENDVNLACKSCYATLCGECLLDSTICHNGMKHDIWCLKTFASTLVGKMQEKMLELNVRIAKLDELGDKALKELNAVEETNRTLLENFKAEKQQVVEQFTAYLNSMEEKVMDKMKSERGESKQYQDMTDNLKDEASKQLRECNQFNSQHASDIAAGYIKMEAKVTEINGRPLSEYSAEEVSLTRSVEFSDLLKMRTVPSSGCPANISINSSNSATSRHGFLKALRYVDSGLIEVYECSPQPSLRHLGDSLKVELSSLHGAQIESCAIYQQSLLCLCMKSPIYLTFSVSGQGSEGSIVRINLVSRSLKSLVKLSDLTSERSTFGSIAVDNSYIYIVYGPQVYLCSLENCKKVFTIDFNQIFGNLPSNLPDITLQPIPRAQQNTVGLFGTVVRTDCSRASIGAYSLISSLFILTDTKPHNFLISDSRRGKVVCFSLNDKMKPVNQWTCEGLSSPAALAYDKQNGVIFCSSSGPETGMIYAISRTGTLIRKLTHPDFTKNITTMDCQDGLLAVGSSSKIITCRIEFEN